MNEELIKEMIDYIEDSEELKSSEFGNADVFIDLLKKGDVPELYFKLVTLLNT